MTTFGIDLGTTNSVIARLVGGRAVAIDVDGSPIVPSVVLYDGDRVVVGREARNLEEQHPERTLRSVKRRMGTGHTWDVGGRKVSPEEASAEILRALKAGAERATGEAVHEVVITVPAYFDDAQRRATLRAGELAGLRVLRLINEPTSASLVYDRVGPEGEALDEPELVLVYDLGGGTFDVSVLEVFGDVREVRATTGNTLLGGDDFDEKLVQHFLDALRTQGADPREDRAAMARLRRVAEATKIRLSAETEVAVREEFLTTRAGKAVHLALTVQRHEFEAMVGPLLRSTVELTERALADAGVTADDIARVCLVGGSTRIPMVRALIEGAFEADVHEEVDPDLAVALGAAMQAGLLAGEAVERILVDVASHSLGVRALGPDDWNDADTFVAIIRRNTVLPATRSQEFATLTDNQPRVAVQVFQGEHVRASQNTLVGEFDFPLEPAPEGTPVAVTFTYTLDGTVKVDVAQSGTQNRATVALSVGDASATAAEAPAAPAPSAPASAVEKKAVALLATLAEPLKSRLAALIERYRGGQGEARDAAEEALLDFFLEHD
jgi:molecular chaperone DnaK